MKITQVDILKIKAYIPTSPSWQPVCVMVHTDEGIIGFGESGIPCMSGRDAVMTLIREIAPYVIGIDPMDNEKIWQKLYECSYWAYGGGPIMFAAISALDMAMWDIKGKAVGLPVHKLLGGAVNPTIKAYASQTQLGWGPVDHCCVTPEEYAREAVRAVEQGFKAIKVDPFWTDDAGKWTNPQRTNFPQFASDWWWKKINTPYQIGVVSERVRAIREAVGDNIGIVMSDDVEHGLKITAIDLIVAVDECDVLSCRSVYACVASCRWSGMCNLQCLEIAVFVA